MKAITLNQPYASLIAAGIKTIETRRWRTNHRGPLLICAGKKAFPRGYSVLPPAAGRLPSRRCLVHRRRRRRPADDGRGLVIRGM